MISYPARITFHKQSGEFVVKFIDFPEGLTVTDEPDKLPLLMRDCLQACIQYRLEDHKVIPEPSPFTLGVTHDRVSGTMSWVSGVEAPDKVNFSWVMSGLHEVLEGHGA